MKDSERQSTHDQWLETHRGLILKVVRAYASHPHDREDLFQEVAVQLWDSIPRFKQESSLTTWIYRVSLYAGIAWSKRERRRSERTREMVQAPATNDAEEDPRLAWLYGQIASLEEVDRSLVLLLLEGMSYREMAETLGISEENVGVKIHRIKKTLAGRTSPGGHDNEL
jgi:RNA polymerase sigma-70 factor (ECF subfamily)